MSDAHDPKSFFDHLNYDVRLEIYKYLDFPPHGSKGLGFIFSCRQAHDEALTVSEKRLRRLIRDVHSGFEDITSTLILPDPSNLRGFGDIRSVTLKLPYAHMTADTRYKTESHTAPKGIIAQIKDLFLSDTDDYILREYLTEHEEEEEICLEPMRFRKLTISWDLQDEDTGNNSVEVCYNKSALFAYPHKRRLHSGKRDKLRGRIVIPNCMMWWKKAQQAHGSL